MSKVNINKDNEQKYCQCLLRKRSGNVSMLDVSWIPVEYGVIGKCFRFWNYDIENEWGCDDIKGGWDDNWVVIKVYGIRSESDIVKMNWDYRKFNWIESSD